MAWYEATEKTCSTPDAMSEGSSRKMIIILLVIIKLEIPWVITLHVVLVIDIGQ